MEAIRTIYDNAPAEIQLRLPEALQQRRVEVIILALDEEQTIVAKPPATGKRYKTIAVDTRVVLSRDELHER